jgi:hypothetical protein
MRHLTQRVCASFLCFTLLFALSPVRLSAAGTRPQDTTFRSFINGITCGQIVNGLDRKETRKAYALMIGSFITGSNYAKNRDSKTDLKGMLLLTEQFCRQNQDQPILTAMIFLDKAIDKRISHEQ